MMATNSAGPWVTSRPATGTVISGLGFDQRMFVALATGQALASIDGLDWKSQSTGFPVAMNDIVYGKDSFVAVGANGTILQSGLFP